MRTTAVTVTRTLKAEPKRVFEAWLSADSMREWFFPAPGFVGEADCDPVVGGRYRVLGVLPGGTEEITGEYLEIDPPRRIVFTFFSGHSGPEPTRVTVTFDDGPVADTTSMTIHHERLPEDGAYARVIPVGWGSVVDKLELYLAG